MASTEVRRGSAGDGDSSTPRRFCPSEHVGDLDAELFLRNHRHPRVPELPPEASRCSLGGRAARMWPDQSRASAGPRSATMTEGIAPTPQSDSQTIQNGMSSSLIGA